MKSQAPTRASRRTPCASAVVFHVLIRFGRTQETRGILFVEAAGAGNATAVSRGIDKQPAPRRMEGEVPSYASAVMPAEPTSKSMVLKLRQRVGYDPVRTRKTTAQLFDHLRRLMVCESQIVLWIDEVHDVMFCHPEQTLRAATSLIQDDRSAVVTPSGTERLEELVRGDPQVQRRFTVVKPEQLQSAVDQDRLRAIMDD